MYKWSHSLTDYSSLKSMIMIVNKNVLKASTQEQKKSYFQREKFRWYQDEVLRFDVFNFPICFNLKAAST